MKVNKITKKYNSLILCKDMLTFFGKKQYKCGVFTTWYKVIVNIDLFCNTVPIRQVLKLSF